MAIKPAFQVIKNAVIDNLNNEDPEKIVFSLGMKMYKVKDILNHFTKETTFASELINSAVKTNTKEEILGNPEVSDEVVKATIKMFQ